MSCIKGDTKFDMVIKNQAIHSVIPYTKNAKKHPKKQVEQLARAIEAFGFSPAIEVDTEGVIISGHGRWEAVQKLGWTELKQAARAKKGECFVPYIIIDDLTELEIKEKRLADNKLAETDVDMILALEELKEIQLEGGDITITGYDTDLLIEPEEKDDEVPDMPEEPKSKLGEIYQLGEHRVMCGSATELGDVERLMDGQKADMVFTSPPYNANTKAGQGDIFNRKKSKKLYADGYSDNLPPDEYVKFAQNVLGICFDVTNGFIFWNVSYNKNSRYQYIQQIYPYLEYLREQICWKKSSTIPFKGSMMRDWEPIYLFSTTKANLGLEKVTSNFWEVCNTGSQAENHKACYPVSLVERGINLINGSEKVYDPFGGSGTTLIAAEKLNRKCYMMELDPKYVDVIIKRWEDYTGKTAVKL